MKYHTLFFSKIGKDVANLSSAAVVIGALRVNYSVLFQRMDYSRCFRIEQQRT